MSVYIIDSPVKLEVDMVQFKFDKDKCLLKVDLRGNVTLQEMKEFINKVLTLNVASKHLKVIEDSTFATFSYSIQQTKEITDIINSNHTNNKLKSIKHAVVCNTPLTTALSMCRTDNVCTKNYYSKVFSTIYGANEWLCIK